MVESSICSVPDCLKAARKNTLRLCSMHEARMRRGGTYDRRVERMSFEQLLGMKTHFGLWEVLSEGEPRSRTLNSKSKDKGPARTAIARCECGVVRTVAIQRLKSGGSRHCGCKSSDITRTMKTVHGLVGTPEYNAWRKMKERCHNPNFKDYPDYGGRGVIVSPAWIDDPARFVQDMGLKPNGASLDRIDVNGNYSANNCRWATNYQQSVNKRNTRMVDTASGRIPLMEACRVFGHPYKSAYRKIVYGGIDPLSLFS